MPKTTTALATPLGEQLDRLAAFEPTEWPVLSLYLDLRPDQHGRDSYAAFLRKTFLDRIRTLTDEARKSFERDADRILAYLDSDVPASANGVAIFACSAASLFETVVLEAPIEQHWLYIGSVPHLYPLARLNDQYPRYAALVVDTNSARLFVCALGTATTERRVTNVKTRKTSAGGWTQARYQRHAENFHLHHIKEVIAILDRVVGQEQIDKIVLACDVAARATLMEQLPQHLADKVLDVVHLDIGAPQHQVIAETLEALRQHDESTDVACVEALLGAWCAGGLGVVGPEDTLDALQKGEVEELLIAATPSVLRRVTTLPADAAPGPVDVDTTAPAADLDSERLRLSHELVTRAQQNGARIRFIEDVELLSDVGGVGALLRFKVEGRRVG